MAEGEADLVGVGLPVTSGVGEGMGVKVGITVGWGTLVAWVGG